MGRLYPAKTNSADTRDRASVASGFLSGHSQYFATGVVEVVSLGTGTTAIIFSASNQLKIQMDGSGNLEFECRDAVSGIFSVSHAVSAGNTYRFVLDYDNTGGSIDLYIDSTSATDTATPSAASFTDTPNWVIGSSDATDGADIRWQELAIVTGRITTGSERTSIMAKTGSVYDDTIDEIIDFAAEETAGRGTAHYDMRDGTESMLERTNNATAAGPDFDTLGWKGSPVWDSSDPFTATEAFSLQVFHGDVDATGGSYNLGSMPADETIVVPITVSNISGAEVTTVSASVTSGTGSVSGLAATIANGASDTIELSIDVPSSGAVTSTVTLTSDGNPDQTITITGTARDGGIPTVQPDSDWDGTAGKGFEVGGIPTLPTESGTPRGSGFTKQVCAITDLAQDNGFYYTTDETLTIGVYADHGDIGWIEKVIWYVEGTTQEVYLPEWSSRANAAGFLCTVDPTNATVTSGDGVVRVYAKVQPVNGLERLLGPIDIFFDAGGSLIDETIELRADGSGDQTTLEGAANATNPAAVTLINITEAGTYSQTSEFTDNETNNDYPTIIRNASDGEVKIVVTDSSEALRIRHDWLWFEGIIFPFAPETGATVSSCYGAGGTDGWWGFVNCTFVDETYGEVGPRAEDGLIPYRDTLVNAMFRSDQRFGCYDCSFDNANGCIGADLVVNSTIDHSYDGFYGETDRGFIGCTVRAYEGQVRKTEDDTIAIASASYSAGTGQTTITLDSAPNFTNNQAWVADELYLYVTTGTLAGQTFDVRDTTNGDDATPTIVVDGDASALAGTDEGIVYIIPHGDGIQWIETGDYDNTLFGYSTVTQADGSQWLQWILAQGGDAGSVTNSAIHMVRIVRDTVGGTTGQLQDNIDHFVIRNVTTEGVGTTENGVGTFADVYIIDSALAEESTTAANVTVFNSHTSDEDGAAAQGTLGTGPTDSLLTDGVPGSGSPLDKGYWNRLRYDLAGNRMGSGSGVSIGALSSSVPATLSTATATAGVQTITLTYSEAIEGTPDTGLFTVAGTGGSSETVTAATVSGTTITITFTGDTPQAGDSEGFPPTASIWTVSFDNSGGDVTTVSNGAPVASLTEQMVSVVASDAARSRVRGRVGPMFRVR